MNQITKKLKNIDNKNKLFYALMTVCFLASIVIGIKTDGQAIDNILFKRIKDYYFSDFFGMVNASNTVSNPFDNGAIYPPLALLLFRLFSLFFNTDMGAYDMRDTSVGMALIVAFFVITSVLLCLCIFKYRNASNGEKLIFSMLMLTSLPMIFLIERGNVVNIALICLLFYIYGYDSESKAIRQLAYIALAIATAFKMYPVIFGLLLLRKKNNWKNIISCIIWGALFFFVPFLFIGGINQVTALIKNILYISALFGEKGYGYKVGINTIFAFFGEYTKHPFIFDLAGNAILYAVTITGILLLLFGKFNAKWKLVAIASMMLVIVPGFSFIYNIVYMMIPLMLFLDEKKRNKLDYIYAILFALQFAFLVTKSDSFLLAVADNELKMNITTIIEAFSLYAMTALLWIEGFITSIIEYKDAKILKKIPANIIIVLTLVVAIGISGAYSYTSTPKKSGFAITAASVFTPIAQKDKKAVKEYKNYAKENLSNANVVAFPKIEMLDFGGKMSYYDKSYYSNSLKTIKKVKAYKPEYIVLYNLYPDDIKSDEKSISDSELDKYMEMNQEIKKLCYSAGYEKTNTYSVNGVGQICIWQKTDKDKNTTWRTSGNGSVESPYTITTADELIAFSDYVNTGHSMKDKVIQLGCDIDMSECENFSPIANEKGTVAFKGVFDGNGYAIKNLTVTASKKFNSDEYKNSALFGSFAGTIMNLTIENSSFSGAKVTSFVRYSKSSNSTIINCLSKNNTFSGEYVGEIASSYKGKIISSVSLDSKYNNDAISFGIVGIPNKNLSLNSVFTNNANSIGYNAYFDTKTLMSDEIAKTLNNNPASNVGDYSSLLHKWDKLALVK